MTLEEAIKHCEEKEKEQALNGCFACAEEHKQLTEWLKDYKRLLEERPQGEWIKHSTYKDVLICSKCNHGSNQFYDTFNFCRNCGAAMQN